MNEIGGICPRCNKAKPIIDPNKDYPWGRDPCLKDLWNNPDIAYACCGHGKNKDAYILTTDRSRFVLADSEDSVCCIKLEGKYVTCVMGINPYVTIELEDGRVFYLEIVKRRLSE